ncbi:MAG: hypothetical protein ABIG61_07410 [Planctomycetota bacterium]
MNVKDIIKEYLEKNGYDGLCGEGCGCRVVNDELFIMCEGSFNDCVPGYLHKCKKADCGECEEWCHEITDGSWLMKSEKPKKAGIAK